MGGSFGFAAKGSLPQPMLLGAGWQLQDAGKVAEGGAAVAMEGYKTQGWYKATVPGTVLTTLVDNKVYPEPLYGENNAGDSGEPVKTSYLVQDGVRGSQDVSRAGMSGCTLRG